MPVEFPPQFPLSINIKTAKALGLTIPPTLLADEADRGILCAVEWTRQGSKIEIPIESSEGKTRTPHICENDLGWFDMRDLDAMHDHQQPLPHPAQDQAQ